jgi:hypothetical protein
MQLMPRWLLAQIGPSHQQALRTVLPMSRTLALASALALAGALAACTGTAIVRQPADPTVMRKIAEACAIYQAAKLGAGIAAGLVPTAGSAIAIIEAFTDPVCADPAKFAGDIATIEWVLKNARAVQTAAKAAAPQRRASSSYP